jgi:hypothetical protein
MMIQEYFARVWEILISCAEGAANLSVDLPTARGRHFRDPDRNEKCPRRPDAPFLSVVANQTFHHVLPQKTGESLSRHGNIPNLRER